MDEPPLAAVPHQLACVACARLHHGCSVGQVIAYVVDTPRSVNAVTFMSNMLYACSILYKCKLPLVLVFNKVDVHSHQFALDWMHDLNSFQQAVVHAVVHGHACSVDGADAGGVLQQPHSGRRLRGDR